MAMYSNPNDSWGAVIKSAVCMRLLYASLNYSVLKLR